MADKILKDFESVLREVRILEKVFENSANPKVIMNKDTKIYACNKAARKLFDIEIKKKRKKNKLSSYLTRASTTRLNVLINQIPNNKRVEEAIINTVELKIKNKLYHFEVNITPYIHNEWHFFMFQDITTKMQMQEARSKFVAIAGHEIKTPLAVIVAYTDLLKRKLKDNEPLMGYLNKIDKKSEVLKNYINAIIDETKIGTGKLHFEDKVHDICEIVRTSVVEMKKTYPNRKIKLVKNTKCANVLVDRMRIMQVLQNLITNAVKHTKKDSEITIKININKDQAKISVKDDGDGISIKEQANIFKPFYRTSASNKTVPGLGLGLYISNEILKRYGSRLDVQSRKHKGSTFSFILPLNTD